MITGLVIENVRIIKSAKIHTSTKINTIVGKNGSGKTSLLEAIALVTGGRSFKTNNIEELVCHKQDYARVNAEINGDKKDYISIVKGKMGTTSKINNKKVKIIDLAKKQAVLVLSPELYRVFENGAETRRRVIDWGLFHVEQDFSFVWEKYQTTLKQRNAIIRSGVVRRRDLDVWNEQLVQHGSALDSIRAAYVNELRQEFTLIVNQFCLPIDVSFVHQSGWNTEKTLQAALLDTVGRDLAVGYTTVGPHRFDLKFYNREGVDVLKTLSRGQQKLVIFALKIAQTILIRKIQKKELVVLGDELLAELDNENCLKLINLLYENSDQLFVTSNTVNLPDFLATQQNTLFHVEQGVIAH